MRLAQIQRLLQKNQQGLTAREMAGLVGVCVRTIQRDLLTLQNDLLVPVTQEGNRYGLMEKYLLPPVSFSLCEAVTIFLASRLVMRQVDESNHHIQEAFKKLAGVLPHAIADRVLESVEQIGRLPVNQHHVSVFETLATAWSTQTAVRMRYQSLSSTEVREWRLEPFFIEMTGIGYSSYVIGQARRKGAGGLRTFKLDRIKSLELLDERFEVPSDLTLSTLLAGSWGIMYGDECEVKLRFSPRVARRVKESIWHPSQVVEDDPDGGCVLSMRVGSLLEMTPWIRSWGPEVEVLEPASLRKDFAGWAGRLMEMYADYVSDAARDKDKDCITSQHTD